MKKIEIISSIFSDHNAMRLDINYKKKALRNTNTWRLSNTFLNNQQVTEEIKREIKKFLETNDSENNNLKPMGCSKSSPKRKVYSNTILPQETRKTLNTQPNFTRKTTGERRKKKTNISRRKEIVNIQTEINEKEMKETIVKINKTKSWSFEKINKIDQLLARLIKKKRRIKSTKLEMKKKRFQETMQKYKRL